MSSFSEKDRLTVYVSQEAADELRMLSGRARLSVSQLCELAIEHYLARVRGQSMAVAVAKP